MIISEVPMVSFNLLRSLVYTAEGAMIPAIDFLVNRKRPRLPTDDIELFKAARTDLLQLFFQDAANITKGVYPWQVLLPESPLAHALRYPKLFRVGLRSAGRKAKNKARDFSGAAKELAADVPDYYRRNFHFQEDGYLSDESAELYDHQVNVLFAGGTDAMRRLILAPIKDHFKTRTGRGLKILEIGAGTGSTSRFTRLALPQAHLTLSDLSEPYLKKARKTFQDDTHVDFFHANASDLPFKDGHFDAVYSTFLTHEVPEAERRAILAECLRVIKPGGFVGLVDSLQTGDRAEFDEALRDFPQEFHEPFYKNYTAKPLTQMLIKAGAENVQSERGFLSKVVWGVKPRELAP